MQHNHRAIDTKGQERQEVLRKFREERICVCCGVSREDGFPEEETVSGALPEQGTAGTVPVRVEHQGDADLEVPVSTVRASLTQLQVGKESAHWLETSQPLGAGCSVDVC